MKSWDKNRNERIYKDKLQKVKSTMHKSSNPAAKMKIPIQNQTSSCKSPVVQSELASSALDSANMKIHSAKTAEEFNYYNQQIYNNYYDQQFESQVVRKENFQKQKNLKKALKDFGLQQYLRKFYELGYDDSNIHKLAKIPYKEYEEFLVLVKAFPGHQVKIISFIDYIKKFYSAPVQLNNNYKNNKDNNYNNKKSTFYLTNSSNLKKTSQSAATKRVNQANNNRRTATNSSKISKKPKSVETLRTKNKIIKSLAKANLDNYGFGFDYYLSENESNKNENKNLYDEDVLERKSYKDEQINNINNQIDKMLNFYMSKLNENMEDSYDSIKEEDSGLANLKILNFNQNMADDLNNANGDELNKRLNISVIKFRDHNDSTPTSNINREVNNLLNLKIETDANPKLEIGVKIDECTSKVENTLGEDDLVIDYSKFLEDETNRNKTLIDDKLEKSPCTNINEEKKEILTQEIDNKIYRSNLEHKDNFNISFQKEEKVEPISYKNVIDTKDDTRPDLDSYSHIRLTKSCEKEYLRQDMDQFDIEYMCRCLGLAVMKHIESGQDKSHIMELIDFSEHFSFFNTLFNSNMDFFFTFFNMENQDKISNLDKLDLNDHKKSDKEVPPKSEKKETHSKPISFFSHVEPNSTKENSEINQEKSIFNSNLNKIPKDKTAILINDKSALAKDLKLINEFFKPQLKSGLNQILNDRYKNMNENTKKILCQDLNSINELDSVEYCIKNMLLTVEHKKPKEKNISKLSDVDYLNLLKKSAAEFIGLNDNNLKENENEPENYREEAEAYNKTEIKENKFSNYQENLINTLPDNLNNQNILDKDDVDEYFYKDTPLLKIQEEIVEKEEPEEFESGLIESNYIFDITNAEKLKNFLLKTVEIYDDDYNYVQSKIMHKRYAPMPDPNQIFEFCANVIINTKMEKEVIIISLIYIERFIFNTGILINSRNWRRLLFTSLIIASKIWDDDSFENNHFAQVFTHLSIGEINLLERSFLELINYKVYVKCSEYFKYFFIIKSIALKYNFDGINLVPISIEKMMVLQEYAFQMQKRLKKNYSYTNSALF